MARDPKAAMRDAANDPGSTAEERTARAMSLFPPNCPFRPVGFDDGRYYLIDKAGQLRCLGTRELARNAIVSLAGDDAAWLIQHYPRPKRTAKGVVDSFRPEAVADSIMAACYLMGHWTPMERVRGRGAWLGTDGDLVLHLGDKLWIAGREVPVGLRGEFVYQLGNRLPRPTREAQPAGSESAAHELLERLSSWSWRRNDLDPRLMLGWICAAMIGGALKFRPVAFVAGEPGVGKTTLQFVLRLLFGNIGMVQVSDTSPAGIYQSLGYDSIPVAVDELPENAEKGRTQEIIKLARNAATGGVIARGGADHHAMQFIAQSSFLFSARIMPGFDPQDASRITCLELLPLGKVPPFDTGKFAELGRQLLRRMADAFPRLVQDALPRWRETLMNNGWDARGADLYGVLLAASDVALYDETHADELADFAARLEDTRRQHAADQLPEFRRCIDYLLGLVIEPWRRGEQVPVGMLTLRASGFARSPDAMGDDVHAEISDDPLNRSEAKAELAAEDEYAKIAALALAKFGMRIVSRFNPLAPGIKRWLAVAATHPALARLFQGTHWSALPGAPGGWRNALLRTPHAWSSGRVMRFGGTTSRAILIPLEAVLAGMVGPEEPAGPDAVRELYRPDEAGTWQTTH